MKALFAAAFAAALVSAPAMAAEPGQPQSPSKPKQDPNEMICKVQQTAAGIPQRTCATRIEWKRENERVRQEMMLKQRGFCGGGMAC